MVRLQGDSVRARRGQATVELALGGLLLISTVMLGLWLSEVSFLSIKVQEASAAAVWNATGRPIDDFNDLSNPTVTQNNHRNALLGVEQQIGSRYQNFDGAEGGSNGTARVFTRGKELKISCVETGPAGPLAFSIPPTRALNNQMRGWFQPRGAAICTASAEASTYELPKTLADRSEGGFFTKFRDDKVIRLCGAGKAVGNACGGGYPVLLGDWGFDGRPTDQIVRDSVLPESVGLDVTDGNVPYRAMIKTLFKSSGNAYQADVPGGGPSATFAAALGGQPAPGGRERHFDRKFYMSYAGSEHDYGDMLEFRKDNPGCLACHFNTAGTSVVNGNPRPPDSEDWRTLRKPCFLGLGGCQ
jgi:hypothetical protein